MKLNLKKINLRLRKLGWTKAELGRRLGMSRQAINYYFQQKNSPTLDSISQIAKVLSVPGKDLII